MRPLSSAVEELIHHHSERRSRHCKVISVCARRRLEKLGVGGIVWKDRVLEPPKYWVERHCKQKTTCWAALPHASGHDEIVLWISLQIQLPCCCRQMNLGDSAFARTWKIHEWLTLVYASVCSGRSRKKNARPLRSACNVCQSGRFNLKNVVGHLPGRETSVYI